MQTDPKEQALRRVANQMEKIGNMLQQWEAKGRNTLLSFVVLISLFWASLMFMGVAILKALFK